MSRRPAAAKNPTGWRVLRWSLLALALIAVGVWLFLSGFDWREIPRTMERLNTAAVLVLMAVLPIFGFPISLVYLVAGAKFGPLLGLGVVTFVTACHLLGTHWVGRSFLREPLQRYLERRGHHLPVVPAGEERDLAAMLALVPGPPYFVRNYLLALSDVPLRLYLPVALVVYVIRSGVAIFLGDMSSDPTRQGILILAAVYAVKLAICAWLLWRLRHRAKELRSARDRLNAAPGK